MRKTTEQTELGRKYLLLMGAELGFWSFDLKLFKIVWARLLRCCQDLVKLVPWSIFLSSTAESKRVVFGCSDGRVRMVEATGSAASGSAKLQRGRKSQAEVNMLSESWHDDVTCVAVLPLRTCHRWQRKWRFEFVAGGGWNV